MCITHILIPMRTHLQIIADAGGYRALADKLGEAPNRARFWERRQSIPPNKWKAVSDAGLATLEELALAAATPRQASSEAA